MRLVNKLNQLVFKKLFFSYIITITFTVFTISMILYSVSSNITAKATYQNSINILKQTSYTSDIIYKDIFSIGNLISNNNDAITSMYSVNINPVKEYNTVSLLSQIASVYPFIKFIGIYNVSLGRYVGTRGVTNKLDTELLQKIDSFSRNDYLDYFPRKIYNGYNSSKNIPMNVITFILYPEYLLKSNPECAIIIDVDESYLLSMIHNLNKDFNKPSQIFVLDSDGIVLSHNNSIAFSENYSDTDYINKILSSNHTSGYFIDGSHNDKLFVSYVKSQNLKWLFINTQPYNLLISNITILRNITLLIALLIVLLSIFISNFMTGKIYSPLESIVRKLSTAKKYTNADKNSSKINEYKLISDELLSITEKNNSLEESVKSSIPALKTTYYRSLLKSSSQSFNNDTVSIVENDLTGKIFSVLILQIDNTTSFMKNFSEDQALYLFALGNISTEIISQEFNITLAFKEGLEIAFILQSNYEIDVSALKSCIRKSQDIIELYYNFTFSAGLGCIVISYNQLNSSYSSASESLKYKFFTGYKSFVSYDEIQEKQYISYKYPAILEKKLLEELNLGNLSSITQILGQLKAYFVEMAYYHALTFSNQLVISILKQYDHLLVKIDDNSKKLLASVQKISNLETLDEIMQTINNLCITIITYTEEKFNKKNTDVIDKIKQYISINYKNPDMSLDSMADMVSLSSAYLGRIFKSITGLSFNDYLNMTRIEAAKELLLNTKAPSSEICNYVGIYNKTYFFTLFKKTYGVTPSQFRKDNS